MTDHRADAAVHFADAAVHLADAAVGILGLGYAGSPLTVAFARAGLGVVGHDRSVDSGTTGRLPASVDVL